MTKNILASIAAGALLFGAGGGAAWAQSNNALTKKDQRFLQQDAHGSAYEKAISELATQKATTPRIKQFAQRDISDHATLDQQARQIAQQNNMILSTNLTQKQHRHVNDLKALNGPAFDQAYVNDMRTINRNDMNKFQKEANNTRNQQVKQFAEHAQSLDQTHENLVQGLQTAQNGSSGDMQANSAAGTAANH